ncbi:MAG: polymer-forming cytoskeletal protein [Bryobacteraceae bacterium]|nr:polymer-forming cytoskeletal protein [Bryobacteraceae bacterium]
MWNRRKDEETQPKPAQTPAPAAPAVQPRETQPAMSTTPMRAYDPPSTGGSATIGKAVMIKGQIFSREDLVIDGEVEGTVEAQEHRVTVGPNGKVQAGVKAREIVVLGSIHGNVDATDKIEIRKEARLVGDIKTARIVIEDGAYFKGSIDITKGEPKQTAPSQPATGQPASGPPRQDRTERKEPGAPQSSSTTAAAPGK